MAASATSFSSSWVSLGSLVDNFSSRRLLLHTPLYKPITGVPSPIPPSGNISNDSPGGHSFDSNVVLILVVLLCMLIGALGVNSVVRCALRCSSRAESETNEQGATQLAQTGVEKKALKTFPTLAYSVGLNLPGLNSECVICLSEFVQGECLRILPKCNHGFHVKCIDKWLAAHSSCPTCRQCLLFTYQKKVGGSEAGFSDSRQIISPLEPESLLINYWDLC